MPTSLVFLFLATLAFVPLFQAVPVQLYGINYNTRKDADWEPASVKCKTYEEITRDLTLLSKLTSRIRILSLSDCGQGELVLTVAKSLGLQVWLGLWVSQDETVFERELSFLDNFIQRDLIDDTVLGISVGSESIYREEVTEDEIILLKEQAKQLLVDNGQGDVVVSICDIAPTYQYKNRLIPNVDLVLVNSFPFWESIGIDSATDYLLDEILPIQNRAGDKEVIMGETGWPSDGFISGVGVASPENQRQYFRDFYCRMAQQLGWKYYYFSGIDNAWRQKQDPNNTIEGNWGIFYADLSLKPWFEGYEFTCGDGTTYSFAEIDFSIPVITKPPTLSPAPTPPLPSEACAAHVGCVEVNLLSGNCCPADNGLVLDCCGDLASGGGGDETTTEDAATTSVATTTTEATTDPTTTTTTLEQATTDSPIDSPTSTFVSSPVAMPTAPPTMSTIQETPTVSPETSPVAFSPTGDAQAGTPPTMEPSTREPTMPSLAGFEFTSSAPSKFVSLSLVVFFVAAIGIIT